MSETKTSTNPISSIPEIESALENEIFENREYIKNHGRYADELRYLTLVRDGNIKQIEDATHHRETSTMGRMSKNPLRQQIYGFIANITLVTRFAIEGGLGEEEAYHLSDIYIQKVDSCYTSEDIWILNHQMVLDFTQRVHHSKQTPRVSSPIQLAIDYIFSHLHNKISLEELADYIGFTPSYLSYLFKQETGETITTFIQKKRIAEAESLLRYSEFTTSEISQYLGFCSQSHFTSVFHKYAGMTPVQFRKTYFRRNW